MEGLYILLGGAVVTGLVFAIVFAVQDRRRHHH
jgi:hypothetical protein